MLAEFSISAKNENSTILVQPYNISSTSSVFMLQNVIYLNMTMLYNLFTLKYVTCQIQLLLTNAFQYEA